MGASVSQLDGSFPKRLNVVFTMLNLGSTLAAVVLPFWYHSWSAFAAFALMYTVCGLGLTVGYHRLFAHRAYSVPKWLEHAIAICGYLAIQRGPIFWVAMHRLHHQQVDLPQKDPHTPREGILHVHFGWIHNRRADVWTPEIYRRWAPDLVDDKMYLWMDKEAHDYLANFWLIVASFVVGGLIGGRFATFSLYNAICFVVWVGLLNRVALLHAFGLINSVCHLIGARPFRTHGVDQSTNNIFVALIIFGEGWHNNHHAFPVSARQGLRWYQIDVAWYVIWLMRKCGLAQAVHVASQAEMDKKAKHLRLSPKPTSS